MSEYPLHTLIQIREQERDQVEKAYSDVLTQHERLKADVRRQDEVVQACESEREEAKRRAIALHRADEIVMTDIGLQREYEAGLRLQSEIERGRLSELEKKVEEFQSVVTAHRQKLAHAQKELMAVEKHYEAWLEEKKIEDDRKQSDKLDEIAIRTWSKS